MRFALTGLGLMLAGVLVLFAIVIGVLDNSLLRALGAYALVIVGLPLSSVGLASVCGLPGPGAGTSPACRGTMRSGRHVDLPEW